VGADVLKQHAARLGAFFRALVGLGVDLDENALPGWVEPPRLRPDPDGRWEVGDRAYEALAVSYFPEWDQDHMFGEPEQWGRIFKYPEQWNRISKVPDRGKYLRLQRYDDDLREVLRALRLALHQVTPTVLSKEADSLVALRVRFARPGADDRLAASAQRILRVVDRAGAQDLSGGTPDPLPDTTTPSAPPADVPALPPVPDYAPGDDAAGSADGGTGPSEVLPGGVPGPPPRKPEPTRAFDDTVLLRALAAERDALEAGTADPLDPRDAPSRVPGTAKSAPPDLSAAPAGPPNPEGPDAIEVSRLLAAVTLHPKRRQLLQAYAMSPTVGAQQIDAEIEIAIGALKQLQNRLTGSDADDAWLYSPLVLAAVNRIGLADVETFPEFAVALGRQLGRTRTGAVLEAAVLLVIALSAVLTGPVGVLVAASADLALSGLFAGIALLHAHERALAAGASSFAEPDRRLDPGSSDDSALAVAGALLSAIALVGPARALLRRLPREPSQLPTMRLDRRTRNVMIPNKDLENVSKRGGPLLLPGTPTDAERGLVSNRSPSPTERTMRERAVEAGMGQSQPPAPPQRLSVAPTTQSSSGSSSVPPSATATSSAARPAEASSGTRPKPGEALGTAAPRLNPSVLPQYPSKGSFMNAMQRQLLARRAAKNPSLFDFLLDAKGEWQKGSFLTKKGVTIRGRYALSNPDAQIVQAGHLQSDTYAKAAGKREYLMFEDADLNWLTGQTGESKGVYVSKSAVMIDDFVIDITTARLYESHELLPAGTVDAATVIEPPGL
jgi:hypothetical protein